MMDGTLTGLVVMAAEAPGAASPLSFNITTMLAQAINVLVVLYLLNRFLFKPLGDVLHRREVEVQDGLEGARKAREEAERLRDETRTALDETRRRAHEEIQRAREAGEQERARLAKAGEDETRRMLEKARAEIRLEREQAIAAIREEAAQLAVGAAEHLLKRSLTEDDHRRLAREFIGRVGEQR